ncbi:MAG: hypothetical protein GX241_06365 [Ruminococcaceae bacterium]|nr:hypothetical protein [Oscillospiraceae bacterium]
MKKIMSRLAALLISVMMVFSLSGCSLNAEENPYIDFFLNGWDGIYEEKEKPPIVWPTPGQKTREVPHRYTVTHKYTVPHKYKVTHKHSVPRNHVGGQPTNDRVIAPTDDVVWR